MKFFKTIIEDLELIIIDERNNTYYFKPYKAIVTKYNVALKIVREVQDLKIKEVSVNWQKSNIDKIRFDYYSIKNDYYVLVFSFME